MRYLVYKWTKDDIESYDDVYGEGAYYEDNEKASCFYTITQFGTKVFESDNEIEASNVCGKIQSEEFRWSSGDVAVWDSVEKFWFN